MFNAVDIAVVGQYVGKEAMAAVGSDAPIVGLIVNLFIGISLGANVLLARNIGQKDKNKIKLTVHTSILFSLLSGVVLTVVCELIASPLIKILSVPANVFDMAVSYLRIYCFGLPFILLYNFESALFRSKGDTRTPLICLFASGIINVVLNLFFVIFLKMNVAGVAYATIISNIISSLLLFVFLLRSKDKIKINISDFSIDKKSLFYILKIGLPSGLQNAVFSISNICIQTAINSLGAIIMAASAAAFNIEIFAFYIINAFGLACTTFIGQNYAAGNIKRCYRITWLSLIQNLIFTTILSGILILFGRYLLSVFNSEKIVVDYGYERLLFILSFELVNVLIEGFSGTLRGYGVSTIPAIISLVGICGVRITWVYTVFEKYRTFKVLLVAYPLS